MYGSLEKLCDCFNKQTEFKMIINYCKIKTEIGPLHLFADEHSVRGIYFEANLKDADKAFHGHEIKNTTTPLLKKLITQLEEYFSGKRKIFDIKLSYEGTEFQKKAWGFLCTIPYGKTISYSEQAKKTKNAGAVRAVGSANGKNPLPIVIPCHRVLRATGELGGFSGGLDVKQKLLELESKFS